MNNKAHLRPNDYDRNGDIIPWFVDEDITKKKKYEVRMSITFDKELTQEEAEKRVSDGLRSVGVIGKCGGIS